MLLTRRMEFSASHRLWREDWSEDRNRAAFGPHASAISHGHNYEVDVTVAGPVDPETGMVMDLKRLSDVMQREVAARLDHRDLVADTPWFGTKPATAENLARVVFDLLDAALPRNWLDSVRLRPTEDYEVEVSR